MKDGKQKKYNIRFVILSFCLVIFLCSCAAEEEQIIEETPPTTEQTIEKFVITETQDGKIKTILEAESAIIDDDNEKKAYLTLPKVKFYENGKYTSILISESGEIDLNTSDIKALGKCTVETVKNEYLQTRDVTYTASKKIISSDSDIKITRDNNVIYGKGFYSDTDLENIVIKNQRTIID